MAGLARCLKKDIETSARALEGAQTPVIHTFLATSKIHREYKLKKSKAEIIRQAVRGVKLALKYVDRVEFSAEDAARTELDFLAEVTAAVIEAGAATVNIPDTVGYSTPEEFGDIIRYLKENVPGIDRAAISVHCHNDLGLAVANSLSAIRHGARQVECCVNGLGERAGNASLEEIAMALKVRRDFWKVTTGINTRQIYKTSRLVSHLTGIPVQRNKAIVGENAFAHEAGIHQDGILKERSTYEIMRPRDVGVPKSLLVLGKHSGRHAFQDRLKVLGYQLEAKELERAFERFKSLADKKKHVFDEDIVALVDDEVAAGNENIKVVSLHVVAGTTGPQNATLELEVDGTVRKTTATGDGPVDAIFNAIKALVPYRPHLQLYQVHAVTGGTDAQAEVSVRLEEDGKTVTGRGADTDTLVASARAYVSALNRLRVKRLKTAPEAMVAP